MVFSSVLVWPFTSVDISFWVPLFVFKRTFMLQLLSTMRYVCYWAPDSSYFFNFSKKLGRNIRIVYCFLTVFCCFWPAVNSFSLLKRNNCGAPILELAKYCFHWTSKRSRRWTVLNFWLKTVVVWHKLIYLFFLFQGIPTMLEQYADSLRFQKKKSKSNRRCM